MQRMFKRLAVLCVLFGGFNSHAQIEQVLFGLTNSWRYNQTVSYDGTNWTASSFDDSLLPSGRGVLAQETNNAFVTTRTSTVLTLGRNTYYFRTAFSFTNSPVGVTLIFSNIVDDGAVYYLNGVEVARLFMPASPPAITYATLASNHEATAFDVFALSGPIVETNLVTGTNVLAVEVHQSSAGSSDIVFGLALSAQAPDPNPPPRLRMPQELPTFGYRLTNAFGSLTFADPVAIVTPPGETNRVFVVEQAGRIAVITNLAAPTRTVFLDIAGRILAGGEEGLLGLAFHPGHATNRQFYIFYTVTATSSQGAGRHDRLSRMLASATNPNVADGASELILFEQYDEASNHNGGDLHFGNDGYLYISLGDEGGGDDNLGNSQRINRDFYAGLFRIDVDHRPDSIMPNPHPANTNNATLTIGYRIPPDNPWIGATSFNGTAVNSNTVRTEFYAVGLRNPWRFSVDRATGEIYLADVGQGVWEEVNLIRRGGNYGWNYREGLHPRPNSGSPPAGVVFDDPIAEYSHGGGTNQGFSITGGVVYRGTNLPGLGGAYVFADYVSGHMWALRADGTNVVPFWRLLTDDGIAGFGIDPRNGDVLTADQNQDTIKRLVEDRSVLVGPQLPPTLFHTGAFTNLTSLDSETDVLTPNAGVVPYELNAPFWSDNGRKTRWISRANANLKIDFSRDGNWSFPTGTVWVKHFDLELTNGVPSSAKRLETRLLVKNSAGVYGVTYRWGNSLTNATLVPEAGMDEAFVINDGGVLRTQVWHYPSRSECLTCHTPVAGFALGFHTAQLNREVDFGTGPTNQIAALSHAGYFSASVSNLNLLPALAHATNEAWSREWRVRSYLHANCVQCHQPGGTGLGSWDARYHNPLSASGLIRGVLRENGGDTNNRVVVPGSAPHSMLLTRISARGSGQMPPLATSVPDTQAIELLTAWIAEDLAGYQSFPEWQVTHFGATNAPNAGASEDADLDGRLNYLEWLTRTDPNSSADFWSTGVAASPQGVQVLIPQLANRGFEVQRASSLNAPVWQPLDVPPNKPFYSATNRLHTVSDAATGARNFYRVRVYEP